MGAVGQTFQPSRLVASQLAVNRPPADAPLAGHLHERPSLRESETHQPTYYTKWSADERIRTADQLFTNQAAIEVSSESCLSVCS